jgi:hypothetical protein
LFVRGPLVEKLPDSIPGRGSLQVSGEFLLIEWFAPVPLVNL